jgi:hypothetical protein
MRDRAIFGVLLIQVALARIVLIISRLIRPIERTYKPAVRALKQ